MRGSSLGYLIKEGGRSIFANRLMSFAAIGILTACMLLIGSAYILSTNVSSIVGFAEKQNEAVVFLEDDVTEKDIDSVKSKIKENKNILSVEFVSKEDALIDTKQELGDAGELLEGISGEENPLPDSFVIKLNNIDILSKTTKEIGKIDGVLQVNAPEDVASTLIDIRNIVTYSGMGVIIILGAVSIMIIANTIKISVYSRRKEINIMKYVGATDRFIRLPFIIEGIIIGIVSSILAFLILWGGYSYLSYWIANNPNSLFYFAHNTMVDYADIAPLMGISFLGFGAVFGGIGSTIFAKKHLRV